MVARAQGSWRSRSTGAPLWSWRRTHSLILGGALLLCVSSFAGAVTLRVDAPPCSAGKLEVCVQDGGAPPRTPAPAQTCPPGTKLGPFGCTPVSTPAPAQTPRPNPTCPPGTVPSEIFGCVEVVGPPTRTPAPTATQAPLRNLGLFPDGVWFCNAGEGCLDVMPDLDTLWAANPTVDNAVWRKHGRTLAKRVVWNLFIPTATGGTAAKTWELVRPQLEERIRERERAVREGREPPPLPAMVTAETSTATFQARAYWTGGFFRANGTEKPIEKWPSVLSEDERWLIDQWRAAGGGPVFIAPYIFTSILTANDVVLDPETGLTWLQHARHLERFVDPPLYPEGFDWKPHPRRPDSDYPGVQAWRVAKTALERWLRRLRFEAPGVLPVLQLSNGAYPDLPAADAVWMDRAVVQLPKIMERHGFPALIQFEAFDFGPNDPTGRSLRLDPALDCGLALKAKTAGAILSVFNATLARATQDAALQCAAGGPR